MSGAWACEGKE